MRHDLADFSVAALGQSHGQPGVGALLAVEHRTHGAIPHALYRHAAQVAGVANAVQVNQAQVEVGLLWAEDGRSVVALFINHEPKPVTAKVTTAFKSKKVTVISGAVDQQTPQRKAKPTYATVRLGANAVAVWKYELGGPSTRGGV